MDPAVPNVARMYDYYLGGRESRPVDREAADRVLATVPQVRLAVRENRAFLERAVVFLAGQGIDQFLDIGSGLPTQRNVHEILAEVSPGSRVVYVDCDPEAVRRGQELLAGIDTAVYVRGDVREVAALCADPQVRAVIDFDRPVGALLLAVLNFVGDDENPGAIIGELRRCVPSGSLLALSHGAREYDPEAAGSVERIYQRASGQAVLRTRPEVLRLLDGCELLAPGLVYTPQWTADPNAPLGDPGTAMTFAAVARL
jgi:hypothetical protein